MLVLRVLFILLFPSLCFATPTWLLCPYVTVNDGNGDIYRDVSLRILRYDICTERGFSRCGTVGNSPYAVQELENNQALIYTDISPQHLGTALSPVGANCSIVTRAVLEADRQRAEGARVVIRQRIDNGQRIAPIPSNVLEVLESRVPQRSAKVIRYIQNMFVWLNPLLNKIAPYNSYAIGTFPNTVVVDNFNRSENPLVSPWILFDTDEGTFAANGTVAECATFPCSMVFNRGRVPFEGDIAIDMPKTGNITGVIFGVNTGTTPTGYEFTNQAGANENRIYRWDVGGRTLLNSSAFIEADGDAIGGRIIPNGGTLQLWLNDGGAGWAIDVTITDTTYKGGWLGGIRTGVNVSDIDNFSMTQPRSSLGARFVR